jgi:hypothetical protein
MTTDYGKLSVTEISVFINVSSLLLIAAVDYFTQRHANRPLSSKISARAKSRVLYKRFLMRSFFKLLKKDLAIALSQQLPLRLMLGSKS